MGGLLAGTEYDRLEISGNAQLGGTLNISLIDGFTPVEGDTFRIVTTAARAGTFTDVTGTELGGGLSLQVSYGSTGVTLTVMSSVP